MNLKQVEQVIENIKGGQFHQIEWEKTLKTRKGIMDTVTKKTSSVVRLGVSYDNKQAVQVKRENGILPSENQGLPYGEWKNFPYLISHKESIQLRVTTSENTTFKTQYFKNGIECKKSDIVESCLKSETESIGDKKIDVFNIKIENIISIK